jgi:hypothetical protein
MVMDWSQQWLAFHKQEEFDSELAWIKIEEWIKNA